VYELSRLCSDREEDIVSEVLRNKTMKIAVVTPKSVTGETGGAVKARNIGLALALGKVIAFTDDDCEPYPDWLENARKYFKRQEVIGIEGLIKSEHDSNNLRCVSNEGFEGIGFMTANLFVLREMANRVNGFDNI